MTYLRFLFLILLSTCLLCPSSLPATAQRRKPNTPHLPVRTATAAIASYDWSEAEGILKQQLATAPTQEMKDSLHRLIRRVAHADELMNATQRLIFIDSIVTDKEHLLNAIHLNAQAGHILSTKQLLRESTDTTIRWGQQAFISALNNTAVFSAGNPKLQLQTIYRIAQRWSNPTPIAGIDSTYEAPDYPFLLSDGITLYFSACGEESIGGYDIFVSRYNPDTRHYVKPANLGMPFNSPANDYFYAIDPYTGIGCFATDRRQPKNKVCVYFFIHTEKRESYDPAGITHESLKRFAALHSIRDTQQGNESAIALFRRHIATTETATSPQDPTFRFVINDNRIANSPQDFRQPEARKLILRWYETRKLWLQLLNRQDQAERDYAHLRSERLATELRLLETQINGAAAQLENLSREIRNIELR